MLSIIRTYLKTPVSLKRFQVALLAFGCVGFLSVGFLYDRQARKTDQYGELNNFLETRIKELNGERTQLEESLQEALDKGLQVQNDIQKRYEKDKKNIAVWTDTANVDSHTNFFKKRIGPIRQLKNGKNN